MILMFYGDLLSLTDLLKVKPRLLTIRLTGTIMIWVTTWLMGFILIGQPGKFEG
jgi:hypothetical protein